MRGQAFKLNRIDDGLSHAAHPELSAWRIVQTIGRCAAVLAADAPANLHLLLETAARLGIAVGVPDLQDEVRELASRRSSSRLTLTAKQLLQAQDSPASGQQAAATQAVAALVARAESQDPPTARPGQ